MKYGANEIAFVQCTKHGEQIVLDGLPALRTGGNVVTNDLHFSGSLHHLVGLRRAGIDVRIVRSAGWQTDVAAMAESIDDDTALVSVTLISNVNGEAFGPIQLACSDHTQELSANFINEQMRGAVIVGGARIDTGFAEAA